MAARRDELRRILAQGLERQAGFKEVLKRVIDLYSDTTATKIAEALRPMSGNTPDAGRSGAPLR